MIEGSVRIVVAVQEYHCVRLTVAVLHARATSFGVLSKLGPLSQYVTFFRFKAFV